MVNQNFTGLSSMHLCDTHGFMGLAMSVRLFALHDRGFRTRFVPITGLAHGRIVSISRGSPPPKKR